MGTRSILGRWQKKRFGWVGMRDLFSLLMDMAVHTLISGHVQLRFFRGLMERQGVYCNICWFKLRVGVLSIVRRTLWANHAGLTK